MTLPSLACVKQINDGAQNEMWGADEAVTGNCKGGKKVSRAW